MTTTLIVNPYASRVTPELAHEVARALGAEQTVFTERAGHATELTRDAGTDAVVVFSGDGGFNEALNGARPETVLGFVPGGGTSVLPRALGLPQEPLAAARAIAAGRTRRISLGRANGRRFGFAAGVGLDAELIRRMDARGRDESGKRPGDLTFAWTAVRTLAEHRLRFDPALEVVGHGRAAFALVANSDPYSYVGRVPLRLPRGARLDGGIDLLAPRSFHARSLPGAVRYLVTGKTRLPLDRAARQRSHRGALRRPDAAPAGRGGHRRRDRGRLRGGARCRLGARLRRCAAVNATCQY